MDCNVLEEDYQKYRNIQNRYIGAVAEENEAMKMSALVQLRTLREGIRNCGKDYEWIFGRYADARERENELMDLSAEIPEEIGTREIVECLRRYGVDRFTFSCGSPGAIGAIWDFVQNGCKVEEMVLVSGDWNEEEKDFQKKPAFELSIC